MKKLLLTGAFALASFLNAQAQEQSFNFNDYTVGNLGTSMAGDAAGQGNWYTLGNLGAAGTTTTNTTSNSVFQVIASDANHGQALQVEGPNGSLGYALAAQVDTQAWWADRTEGNDIYVVEFDYYTGTAGDSKNAMGIIASAGAQGAYTVGGFTVDTSTLEVYGRAYLSGGSQGAANYLIILSDTDETLQLPENTWVRLSSSFDTTTGVVAFKVVANDEVLVSLEMTADTALIGQTPTEADIVANNLAAGNTVAATGIFDNIVYRASNQNILAVKDVTATTFSVFPNPANDIVTVAGGNALVNNVSIVDINGRTVKSVKLGGVANAQINVSDLAKGVYVMTISSDKGVSTQKIMKN